MDKSFKYTCLVLNTFVKYVAGLGIEPGTSASCVRRATDCSTLSGSVCVRERERERGGAGCIYSHVSGGKFYFEKIIAILAGA